MMVIFVGSRWLLFLNIKLRAIRPHGIECKQIPLRIDGRGVGLDEHVGMDFAWGTFRVVVQEKLSNRRGNRRVIEDPVDDRILRDPRRDKDGRNANPESIELKLRPGPGAVRRSGKLICGAGGRRDMIKDPSMFVINHQQRGASPEGRVSLDPHIYFGDQELTSLHVMVRVLIAGYFFSTVGFVVVVIWLDEGILGQASLVAITQKLLVGAK